MPKTRPTRARRPDRLRPYLVAGVVVVVVAGLVATLTVLTLQRWRAAERDPAGGVAGAGGADSASSSTVTLYYVAEDGLGLVGQAHELPFGVDPVARARAIVERQLGEAPPPLLSPFPEGTRLRALYLADDGSAFVDLSREVTAGHRGGSLDELFTVYALVNALTTNMPEIASVQILVEGAEADTLAGHVDLRQPLTPSLQWVIDETAPRGDGTTPAAVTPTTVPSQ